MCFSKPFLVFVLTGPSGAGKTTILNEILSNYPHVFKRIVTYTTRPPRDGEVNGKDYHFVSFEEFKNLNEQNFFIEVDFYSGNYYGIPRIRFEPSSYNIIAINFNGVKNLKRCYGKSVISIALLADKGELAQRLMARKGGDVEKRLKNLEKEFEKLLKFGDKYVDYFVNNETIETCTKKIEKILDIHLRL